MLFFDTVSNAVHDTVRAASVARTAADCFADVAANEGEALALRFAPNLVQVGESERLRRYANATIASRSIAKTAYAAWATPPPYSPSVVRNAPVVKGNSTGGGDG